MKNPIHHLALLGLLYATPASAAVLFADNFNRSDNRNINGSAGGITNNTGTDLSAGAYTQPHLDPNNAAPTYGAEDTNPGNGGGAQILSNTLQLAVGPGTSNAFINHNFTNPSMLGGFSVTIDIAGMAGTSNGQGGGFGIGMTLADAMSSGDAWTATNKFQDGFPGGTNDNQSTDVSIASFWMLLRGDNSLIWGTSGNALTGGTADVGRLGVVNGLDGKTGTISAVFSPFSDFNAGTSVGFEIFYNDVSQGSGSFVWGNTDANYIGLDARDGTGVSFDNLVIEAIPEPGVSILGALGIIVLLRRRSRVHHP